MRICGTVVVIILVALAHGGGCASAPAESASPVVAETPWIERPVVSLLPGETASIFVIGGGGLIGIAARDRVAWRGYEVFGEVIEVFDLWSRVRLVHGERGMPAEPKRVRVWRGGVPRELWPGAAPDASGSAP